MARKSSVSRIFCRSSGMMKMALSLPIATPLDPTRLTRGGPNKKGGGGRTVCKRPAPWPPFSLRSAAATGSSFLLGRPRPHLVLHRLLRRGDDLGGPAPGLDLLPGRLREVVGPERQPLGQLPGSQYSY